VKYRLKSSRSILMVIFRLKLGHYDHENFTIHHDSRIDSAILRHLQLIVEKILKYYPKVDSIILTGGFGRGEGSVLLSEGNVIPISDYDICVVSDCRVNKADFEKMLEEIKQGICVTQSLSIDLDVVTKGLLRQLFPDISSYELKAASKLLYGEDLRHLIPITESEVSASSGVITLCIRAITMSRVAARLHSGRLTTEEKIRAVYECSRAFTEIATALSLLEEFYRPSYSERALLFNECFMKMKVVSQSVPKLSYKVREYTDIKLWSKLDEKTPIEAFSDVLMYLKPVFLYFMSKYLQVDLRDGDWRRNAQAMYKGLRRLFLQSYITPFLKKRHLPSLLEGPLNLAFQLLNNIKFVKDLYETRKIVYLKPLLSSCLPLVKTFISASLIFYSLDDSMRINPELLRIGHEYLTKVYPCEASFSMADWTRWDTWEKLREAIEQSFQLCLLNRQKRPF